MMATESVNTNPRTTGKMKTEENSGTSVVLVVVVVAEPTIVTFCENPCLGAMVTGDPDVGLAEEGAQAYVPGVGGFRKNPLTEVKSKLQPLFPTAKPVNVI
jgi:hypothetical protein